MRTGDKPFAAAMVPARLRATFILLRGTNAAFPNLVGINVGRRHDVPQSLAEEFSMNISIPFEVLLVRVFGAVVLCGLIGLEREFHKNTAGLRTNMLIGLAAVTFCIITIHMMETMAEGHEAARLDPIRLVEAVTAGIAFLAAGVVVYTRGDVKGLTTGASMWLSAAIGLSAGLGMWPLALVAAGAGIVVLWTLRRLQVATGIKED
jgi:putative Mg2+ transporter-C (MgtC) family protein